MEFDYDEETEKEIAAAATPETWKAYIAARHDEALDENARIDAVSLKGKAMTFEDEAIQAAKEQPPRKLTIAEEVVARFNSNHSDYIYNKNQEIARNATRDWIRKLGIQKSEAVADEVEFQNESGGSIEEKDSGWGRHPEYFQVKLEFTLGENVYRATYHAYISETRDGPPTLAVYLKADPRTRQLVTLADIGEVLVDLANKKA